MLQARAVLPDDANIAGQNGHALDDFIELIGIGLGESHNELLHVVHLAQLGQDRIHGGLLELGVQRGQHNGDGLLPRKVFELLLQTCEIALSQPVQCGNDTCLIEVCHVLPSLVICQGTEAR